MGASKRRLGAGFDGRQYRQDATRVFPEPTSPWSSRSIGADLGHVAVDLADDSPLSAGQLVRKLQLGAQLTCSGQAESSDAAVATGASSISAN